MGLRNAEQSRAKRLQVHVFFQPKQRLLARLQLDEGRCRIHALAELKVVVDQSPEQVSDTRVLNKLLAQFEIFLL